MAIYLITYDLREAQYEEALLDYLKKGEWKEITKSSYAVIRSNSPSEIVADIRKITKNSNTAITVYVLPIKGPSDGLGPKDVNDWLNQNLLT